MYISECIISIEIQQKIFKKHNLARVEIEDVFWHKPYYFRTRKNRYMAIGQNVTVVFEYRNKAAVVITAYRSSRWQKKLYQRK